MGYIYIIKNDINDSVYIGQTSRNIEVRWKEHVRHTDQVIGKAINKYGCNHFYIEEIEKCPDEQLDEREKYWINYYNSFKQGYNTTTGGQEKREATEKVQEVIDLWNEGLTVNRIVERTKLNVETVRSYLNKNGISHEDIRSRANIFIGKSKARPIFQYDKDMNLIKEWPSILEATKYICAQSTILKGLKDGRPHGGFIWKYKETI